LVWFQVFLQLNFFFLTLFHTAGPPLSLPQWFSGRTVLLWVTPTGLLFLPLIPGNKQRYTFFFFLVTGFEIFGILGISVCARLTTYLAQIVPSPHLFPPPFLLCKKTLGVTVFFSFLLFFNKGDSGGPWPSYFLVFFFGKVIHPPPPSLVFPFPFPSLKVSSGSVFCPNAGTVSYFYTSTFWFFCFYGKWKLGLWFSIPGFAVGQTVGCFNGPQKCLSVCECKALSVSRANSFSPSQNTLLMSFPHKRR